MGKDKKGILENANREGRFVQFFLAWVKSSSLIRDCTYLLSSIGLEMLRERVVRDHLCGQCMTDRGKCATHGESLWRSRGLKPAPNKGKNAPWAKSYIISNYKPFNACFFGSWKEFSTTLDNTEIEAQDWNRFWKIEKLFNWQKLKQFVKSHV